MLSKLRYTVGQKYVFIKINFKTDRLIYRELYIPSQDLLLNIEYALMSCEEHHKVNWQHQRELAQNKFDGFIFKLVSSNNKTLKEGTLWYNQYPYAVYGQTSTDRDYQLQPSSYDDFSENYFIHRFRDVSSYLYQVYLATQELKGSEYFMLQQHYEDVIQTLNRDFNLDVKHQNIVLKKTDGSHKTLDMKEPVIVRLDPTA